MKLTTNLRFIDSFWGAQLNLNWKLPINYRWSSNEKHFLVGKFLFFSIYCMSSLRIFLQAPCLISILSSRRTSCMHQLIPLVLGALSPLIELSLRSSIWRLSRQCLRHQGHLGQSMHQQERLPSLKRINRRRHCRCASHR